METTIMGDIGFRVWGLWLRVLGFRVWGVGFRGRGSGFRTEGVWGFGFRA